MLSSVSKSNSDISKPPPLAKLESRLGYRFNDPLVLRKALTHKSCGSDNNERLEFLGDAVLGYVIAEKLYHDQPDLAEDNLTLLRAELVRKETLHEIASCLELGLFLQLGPGERKSGGRGRASILADAMEAVIGAVLQDSGVDSTRDLILRLFAGRLANVQAAAVKDPKTRLQELLQAAAYQLPVYEVVGTHGSDHARTFTIRCRVDALALATTATGASRREGEKAAAADMIELVAARV